ncbi:MAG: CpaD family pilus assembly protein [Hyphomicrobiaceae bacterium]
MTLSIMHTKVTRRSARAAAIGIASALAGLALSGCANGLDPGGHVAGWAMISAEQRHPILVGEEPATHSVRVARGSNGLTPHQRAGVADFIGHYRAADAGNSKLSIAVPSGSPNEISALRAVADVRAIAQDFGIDDSRISVSPYNSGHARDAAVRVSYTRYVAEAPQCGEWPTNLADDARNLPYPNLGCATQRNFAMQVANPADLLGPRTMTPAVSERRDTHWEKFKSGDSTIAKREQDERASTKTDK